MLRSIRSRLIASSLLVTMLAMGVAAGLAWSALDRAFLDVLRENLLAQSQRVAQTLEASGTNDLGDGSTAPYSQVSNVLAGYHTRVIDEEGVVVLDLAASDAVVEGEEQESALVSLGEELATNLGIPPADDRFGFYDRAESSTSASTVDLLDRAEVRSALTGEPATEVRSYSWAADRRILYAAYPVRSPEGDVVSVVYVASPLPRLNLSLLPDTLGPQVLGGAAVAVMLAGLVGFLLARQLARPLTRLTEAASALARGEPVRPLPPASTAELDQLGAAFNTMNTNLVAAHDALAAQARQREAILHGLADAVLAVDAAGEVMMANPPAGALLETASEPILDAIRHTLARGEPHATEITVQSQVVELLVTPLRDGRGDVAGAVAVGHDVTAYRQLDRLRTSFVSDVSHELRTPLTAIKGFVETLQDGAADDPQVRDRFLGTVATETERLIRLTNDLLLLTRADAGRLDMQFESTDVVASARRAAAQLRNHARQKRVALNVVSPAEPLLARADPDRIHQVLVNLLDNAIKFTPAEGRVSVSFAAADEQVSCTIADTGLGIPAEEVPHLFERFYRGDRSRARDDESGAGLGLAIARAIVEAHGGRIWVESQVGQGTATTFTLPSA
jgi:signal transduction histidine kinase